MANKIAAPSKIQSTGYWLMKSEPETYSIDQLKKDKKTLWTGVRNYQARNFMMHSMVPGDQVLFYHSNAAPAGVVGIAKISQVHLPDPTALEPHSKYFDPKANPDRPIWFCAEVSYVGHLTEMVPLSELRSHPALKEMLLLRKGQRLSILPVLKKEFNAIVEMGSGCR